MFFWDAWTKQQYVKQMLKVVDSQWIYGCKSTHKYRIVQRWARKAQRLSDPCTTSKNWTAAWSAMTPPWWTRKWCCRLADVPTIVRGRVVPAPPYFWAVCKMRMSSEYFGISHMRSVNLLSTCIKTVGWDPCRITWIWGRRTHNSFCDGMYGT